MAPTFGFKMEFATSSIEHMKFIGAHLHDATNHKMLKVERLCSIDIKHTMLLGSNRHDNRNNDVVTKLNASPN